MEQFSEFGDLAFACENKILETLNSGNYQSVSGPDVGLNYSILGYKEYQRNRFIVAFNPRIVYKSDEMVAHYETCASYPGLRVRIARPMSIRVRYYNVRGEIQTVSLSGADSLNFQHEMTHLGDKPYPFYNDANFLHKMKAIKDWKIISRRIKNENYKREHHHFT